MQRRYFTKALAAILPIALFSKNVKAAPLELSAGDAAQVQSMIDHKIAALLEGFPQYPPLGCSLQRHVAMMIAKIKGEADEAEPE